MAIDTLHPTYETMKPIWQKCRDAFAGQYAVHARGQAYLPVLAGQTPQDYLAYKMRATYFNASGRTLDGLIGMVFRKQPYSEYPDSFESIYKDIDLKDTTAEVFAERIMREVLSVYRAGVLVEFPQVSEQPPNAATAAQLNLRPYANFYPTESIINWKVERINNAMQPTLIVLTEQYQEAVDEYSAESRTQYRVLRLIDSVYIQSIYRQTKSGYEQYGDDIIPLMNGRPIPFIPFYSFGAFDNDINPEYPPLLDLVDLNLAHYRVSADYEYGTHFTGLPMLFLAGVTLDENEKIYLGSQTAIVSNNENAKGQFIEFSGQGLGALEKNLDRKEKQMAVLGARLLEQQKAGVETQGAMQQRVNGEASVLAGIANMVSEQMEKMLNFMAMWEGITQEIEFELNTDYQPTNMTPQELAELVKAWQAGAISFETLFKNLQKGEIIDADESYEDEMEKISNSEPNLSSDLDMSDDLPDGQDTNSSDDINA